MRTDPVAERIREKARLSMTTACEKCGARIGEPCTTPSGLPTLTPHLYRNRRGHALYNQQLREKEK